MCVRKGALSQCPCLQVCVIQSRGGDDLVAGSGAGFVRVFWDCVRACVGERGCEGVGWYTGSILPTAPLHEPQEN